MHHSQISARGGTRLTPPLLMNDLCAQLAPLNRYGMPGFGAAVVDVLRSLAGVSRSAVCAAAGCNRA